MLRGLVITVVCLSLLSTCSVTAVAETDDPEIVDLYPNPAAMWDEGEFVTLRIPAGTNLSEYTLADEHVRVSLSNATAVIDQTDDQYITFSTDANRTAALTDRTVVEISASLRLADRGDRVRLLRHGTAVDEVTYDRAPEAQVYDVQNETWRPLGATDKPVISASGGDVETFVLPDEPDRVVEFLESATDRILLAGYTIAADDVVETLLDAHERGVDVEVVAEGSPVGGMDGYEAAALDRLDREGVPVQVIGGKKARYRFHHAKYAVVDDRALVTTENWKQSGTGGKSSRGWAVVTTQEEIVDGLVDIYRADTGWEDAIPWDEYDDISLVDGGTAQGTHPTVFESETHTVDRTQLLVAPDNAEETILATIESAEESIDVKQVRISDPDFPFLKAVVAAAERGVEVRILLSAKWYVEEENRELKAWLEAQADRSDLPLSVRLADPGEEFEKIHAKGLIVDRDITFVGSINWNNNSVRNNREVGLLLHSEDVGEYFTAVFESDWSRDGSWDLPIGYVAACLGAVLSAVVAAQRLEFEN